MREYHKPFEQKESGQAVVLIALLMIISIAFLGLAVDGGQYFLTNRQVQNATDAGVLVATHGLCQGDTFAEIQTAVTNSVVAAGFDPSEVQVNQPPTVGPEAGNSEYVEVIVGTLSPTYFIHIVYDGPTYVQVIGVGRCRPPIDLSAEYENLSAVSLGTGSKAIDFSGGADVEFCGGGTHSNGGSEGPPQGDTVTFDPSCTTPTFSSTDSWAQSDNMPTGTSDGADAIDDPYAVIIPPPNPGNCGTNGAIGNNDNVTIDGPQCYTSLTCGPGKTVTVTGDSSRNDNILYLTGDIDIKCTASIQNVMIYVEGDVDFNSQADVTMLPMLGDGEWAGLMMWGTASTTYTLNGQATSVWVGTIYAPNADVQVNGGSGQVMYSQIIANQVDFSGSSGSTIVYDADFFWDYEEPPGIEYAE